MKKSFSFLLVLSMALVGCASPPTMEQLAKDSANASQVRAKAEQERREQEQKRMEQSLGQIPSWSLEAPHPDATGVYAVGMGESDTVRVSMHKAMLDAEFGLSKIYKQELSGSERSITQDNNAHTSNVQYTELIDKLVSQVSVVGFEVVHQDIKVIDGKYHSFVLLKLPYDQFNSVLKAQEAKSNDTETEKQFTELERRLDKRRQQRLEEAQKAVAQPAPTAPVSAVTAANTKTE